MTNQTTALLINAAPLLAVFAVFYFLVIAPASKQRRKTNEMLSSLKKGDRVVTSGGIYGTIQGVEAEVIYLKIAENVKVKVQRSSITAVLAGDEVAGGQ